MSLSSVYLQSIQGLVKGEKNQISFTGTFFEVNEYLEALNYAIDNGIENVTLSINVTDGKIVIHLVRKSNLSIYTTDPKTNKESYSIDIVIDPNKLTGSSNVAGITTTAHRV